jgi:hypothetical protein
MLMEVSGSKGKLAAIKGTNIRQLEAGRITSDGISPLKCSTYAIKYLASLSGLLTIALFRLKRTLVTITNKINVTKHNHNIDLLDKN